MLFGIEWLDTAQEERVLVHTHPSRWIMFKQLGVSAFTALTLVPLLFSDITEGVSIGNFSLRALILIAIPLIFVPVGLVQLRRLSTHYVLTDRNLWAKTKIFARDVDPTVLSRVQSCNYEQDYMDRLLSKGTVRVETAGTGGTDVVLRDIPYPGRVARMIREKIEESDNHPQQTPGEI